MASNYPGLAFNRNGDNQAHGINSGTLTNGDTLSVSITYEVA